MVAGLPTSFSDPKEQLVYEVSLSLASNRIVSNGLYERAVSVLGDEPWPPEGSEQVEIDVLYDRFAAAGLEYGPAFQGLIAAWRLGDEVFAEVCLPEGERAGAGNDLSPSPFSRPL